MKIGKIRIDFMYEKWPNWALGIWIYKNWFSMQIFPFKVVIYYKEFEDDLEFFS